MADITQNHQTGGSGNAPVERFNDGAVKASIFRNVSKEGLPFYNVTFARIYTDPKTGQTAETQSFSGTDVLKVRRLADQAYHAVDRLKKHERTQNIDQAQTNGSQEQSLSEQRDMLMGDNPQPSDAAPRHVQQTHAQNQPELER